MTQHSERQEQIIGTFISDLYAILVSAGIGSVVLRENFNPDDVGDFSFRLGAAVFVVGVVISYWWDWAKNIERKVDTNSLELTIDLLILVVFLLMFAFYDRPEILATLLVALSAFDLWWVRNHCHSIGSQPEITPRRWIVRKIVALAIFLIVCVFLLYLQELMSSGLFLNVVGLAAVSVSFALVRLKCFRRD